MPLFIVNDDITKLKVDAIVNAANNSLLGGSGVDGCIHRAAGPELLKECKTLNGCDTGDAKITKGYKLPAKYVIHTVGPVWRGGEHDEAKLLASCYYRSLKLATENECESIAFPMISTGVYGYPRYEAMQIAQKAINNYLEKLNDDLDVYIVLFGNDISGYFDPEDGLKDYLINRVSSGYTSYDAACSSFGICKSIVGAVSKAFSNVKSKSCENSSSITNLNDVINNPEETFSSMVMRKIKESGMDEVSCYKAANVNKQIFSKIRSSAWESETDNYQPTKSTAMSFAIALKLPLDESKELLQKAGYAFSRSDKTDIIVEYCISNSIYDIFRVNEILFTYQQPCLGSKWH